ncbi:hypothetical protein [Saccharicrinis aurantiacus]|uniref:hypothetical protein n=1 Tax=Saccharicrinis aurantiacus TaxID=1849719 RepID=UPI0008383FB5|nr:hypothetical protein [Saccharicrinis aurantiacus]
MKNDFEMQLSAEEATQINDALGVLNTILLPKLVDLSPEQKLMMPKMGDKTLAFVSKCIVHMEENPELTPQYLNVDEARLDLNAVNDLRKVMTPINQISAMINDSMIIAGSEAYTAALAFYTYIKGAVKAGVPGTEVIYNDLKVRFPGRKSKKTAEV